MRYFWWVVACLSAPIACKDDRVSTDAIPTYNDAIAALLSSRCSTCHEGAMPAAGWRADSYVGVIGCTTDGKPVTVGGDRAPILGVLARPDHATLLSSTERTTLATWVALGAPSTTGGVHPTTFGDPRTANGHAQFLRDRRYRPLLDPKDADACGQCHLGAPLPPATPFPAANATPCTTCHTEEGGAFACTTCHGASGRSFPPTSTCFKPAAPGAPAIDAHAAHVTPTALHAEGLPCSTCHPVPTAPNVVSGAHLDGYVEIFFDFARAGNAATFAPATKQCAGTCHSLGGRRATIAWTEAAKPVGCNDCHTSPPANHYAGACTSCHREANADGTALTQATLHVNGKVDLGDGSGLCGACHGTGADPWPSTNAHAAHRAPANALAVPCETCHVVPGPGDRHPVGGGAHVRFRGLAVKGGSAVAFDPGAKSCALTYCHTGRGGAATTPKWTDGPAALACGNCHSSPPPPPHSPNTSCGGTAICHTGSLATPTSFTPAGKATHVDGFVTRGLAP